MSDAEQRAERAARELLEMVKPKFTRTPIFCVDEELLIEGLAAIILKHQPAWVSVQERLPELTGIYRVRGRRVYFIVKDTDKVFAGRVTNSLGNMLVFWPDGQDGYLAKEVSHWMPWALPAAPRPAAPAEKEKP